MAIFPFVISKIPRREASVVFIHHEKIHFKQQIELLFIFFFFAYLLFFLYYTIVKRNVYQAYRSIPFEKEAYANEENLEYIKNRKWFSWTQYLF